MGFFDKIKKDVTDTLDWKKVKIVAGHGVYHGEWDFNGGMMTPDPASGEVDCIALMGQIESLTVQTEESVKDLAKTLGLTVAGGVLLGPLGAIAGYFAGGNRKQVCVMVKMKDKKQFLAVMDQRIYQQMMALSMM
ncbi:MAG: hypothetical protein K2X77_31190 [Candidatus Obscuribacterales bacterium]|jgi:ribosomal protein S15P/S13E|nr:hypothetical protein [Candidatus Obscuribacterales bacterium]